MLKRLRYLIVMMVMTTIITSCIGVGGGAEEIEAKRQSMTSPWWCGASTYILSGEIINRWTADYSWQQVGSGPQRPLLPPGTPAPPPAIGWMLSSPSVFSSAAMRHAFWATAAADEVGDYLERTASQERVPWVFINWSDPADHSPYFNMFDSRQMIGHWWYRWSPDLYTLGRIEVSRALPDNEFVSARETYIGRRADRNIGPLSGGAWEQKARLTCLTPTAMSHPLVPGSGYSDEVRSASVALYRDPYGCWTCFNY